MKPVEVVRGLCTSARCARYVEVERTDGAARIAVGTICVSHRTPNGVDRMAAQCATRSMRTMQRRQATPLQRAAWMSMASSGSRVLCSQALIATVAINPNKKNDHVTRTSGQIAKGGAI